MERQLARETVARVRQHFDQQALAQRLPTGTPVQAMPDPDWLDVARQFDSYLLVNGKTEASRETYGEDVKNFWRWCTKAGFDPHMASPQLVAGYLAMRRQRVVPNSVARHLSCLRAFFAYCRWAGLRTDDPTLDMHIKRQELLPRVPYSEQDLEALLAAAGTKRTPPSFRQRNQAMILLAYGAGLRVIEIWRLRAGDVLVEQGLIIVRGKGGREDYIAPGDAVMHAIQPFLRRPDGVLWHGQRGPLTLGGTKRLMDAITRRAGIKNGRWHRFRVTFANHALEAGVRIERLQKMMRHRNIETTIHYAGHFINKEVLDEMRELNLAGKLSWSDASAEVERHGTIGMYRHHHCRCHDCRQVWNEATQCWKKGLSASAKAVTWKEIERGG